MNLLQIINSKIRNKLIFGFVFISLFVGLVSYIGLSTIWQIEGDYKLISTKSIPILQHLEEMKFACVRLISSTSEFAYIQTESQNKPEVSPLEQENNLIHQSCNSCHKSFSQYEQIVKESFPELKQHINKIRNAGGIIHIAALEFIEMKKLKISGAEPLGKKEEMEIDEMEFLKIIDNVIDLTNKKLEEEKKQLETTISLSLRNILIVSGITFFLSVLIGILYSRSISNPITKLTHLADDFRKGNLAATIEIKSCDEIGVLGRSFNEMAGKIKRLISKLENEVKLTKQIGESLKKSNHQIKLILEVAGEGIFGVDLEGNFTSVNLTASKLLGYEIEELLGKHSHSVMHHSYQDGKQFPNEKCAIYETLHDGKSKYGEEYYWKKNGTCFPVVFSSLPIIENKMITGAVVTFSDITARKRTEIESQVMYEITQGVSTTDSLDELLKLIHQSISKVVYAENCFVALHDKNTGLFSFPFFKDKFDSAPAPVHMDKSCSAYVFRTGKSLIITQEIFEQLREQDLVELVGSSSPSWIGVPLYTPSRIIGVLVLQHYEEENVYDEHNINFLNSIGSQIAFVIERKLAEQELRESQSLYYSFIEQLPNAVFRKDREGRYVIVNSEFCRLKGLKKEDFIGKKPKDVAGSKLVKQDEHRHSDKYASLGEDIQNQILQTGKIYETEEEYSYTEGVTQHMHVIRMPVFDSHKTIIGTQGIMFDITTRKLAEEALRESEVKLKVILESTADGILAVDGRGKIIKTNKRFAELWRIPQLLINSKDDDTLLNFVLEQLIDPEEFLSKVKRLYNSTAEDLDQLHFKDGRIFERFSKPLLIQDSSVGRVWSFRDITYRMRAVERLRESEDQFRNLVENISDVFFIANEDGKLIYCSPNFFTQTNFLPQDVYGKSYLRFVAQVDRKKIIEFYAEQIKNNVLDSKVDFRANRKGGKSLWVEQNARIIRDNNGNVKQFRIIVRDISERKRAEEALQNERLLLRTLIDNIPDSIYSKDLACRKTLANLTDISYSGAKSEAEILGKTDFDFYPKELADGFFANDQSVMQSGEPVLNKEEYVIDGNGHQQWLLTSKLPLKDEKGNIIGIVGIGRDITERKRWEEDIKKRNEQLSKINAEKDKFFSIIAHDLKSPLQGLLGLSEILAIGDEDFSKAELTEYGKFLHESAANLFKLIENLLEWAQMQRGSIKFTPLELNLIVVTLRNIETIKYRAAQKGITIINEILITEKVYADEKMIDTIFRNLLSNAVKFTRRDGTVILRTKKIKNEMLEISVSDTGVGMYEEKIKKLFKIDEMVSSKGTDGEPSTGLGLLLCKEFVEKHGGRIWVDSEEGKGSTFTFSLPVEEHLTIGK